MRNRNPEQSLPVTVEETEFIIGSLPAKKTPGLDSHHT